MKNGAYFQISSASYENNLIHDNRSSIQKLFSFKIKNDNAMNCPLLRRCLQQKRCLHSTRKFGTLTFLGLIKNESVEILLLIFQISNDVIWWILLQTSSSIENKKYLCSLRGDKVQFLVINGELIGKSESFCHVVRVTSNCIYNKELCKNE